MIKQISSTQNTLVKEVISLKQKSSFRNEKGKFVVEGIREVNMAITEGYEFEYLFFAPSMIEEQQVFDRLKLPTNKIIYVSESVYKKLAYRGSTEGVLGVAYTKKHRLESLDLPRNPLILVMESIEKPGNIGAMLRTADAAGVDAVIISNPVTDLYNPNIIRSSLGCLFSSKIGVSATPEVITFLKEKKINCYVSSLRAAQTYTSIDYNQPTALVVGAESNGVSQQFEEQSTTNVIIPMHGKVDSMNVSVSAAILLFEAVRVRKTTSCNAI